MGRLIAIASLHLVVAASYFVVFWSEELMVNLGAEDGLVESLGALSLLAASLFFAWTFWHSRGRGNEFLWFRTQRNVLALALAAAFLFAGGEEISWGQRIFGWATPVGIEEINVQGETNLHNMAFLQNFIPAHTLFNLFWAAYGVALPLLNRLGKVRTLLARIGVPVAPLWVASLFVLSYLVFKVVAARFALDSDVRSALNELKEGNAAFACAVLGLCVLVNALSQQETRASRG